MHHHQREQNWAVLQNNKASLGRVFQHRVQGMTQRKWNCQNKTQPMLCTSLKTKLQSLDRRCKNHPNYSQFYYFLLMGKKKYLWEKNLLVQDLSAKFPHTSRPDYAMLPTNYYTTNHSDRVGLQPTTPHLFWKARKSVGNYKRLPGEVRFKVKRIPTKNESSIKSLQLHQGLFESY